MSVDVGWCQFMSVDVSWCTPYKLSSSVGPRGSPKKKVKRPKSPVHRQMVLSLSSPPSCITLSLFCSIFNISFYRILRLHSVLKVSRLICCASSRAFLSCVSPGTNVSQGQFHLDSLCDFLSATTSRSLEYLGPTTSNQPWPKCRQPAFILGTFPATVRRSTSLSPLPSEHARPCMIRILQMANSHVSQSSISFWLQPLSHPP